VFATEMKRHAGSPGSDNEAEAKRVEADFHSEPDDSGDSNSNDSDDCEGDDGFFDSDDTFVTQSDVDSDEGPRAADRAEPRVSFINYRRRVRALLHRYQHIRNQVAIAVVNDFGFDRKLRKLLSGKTSLLFVNLNDPGVTAEELEAFEQEHSCRMPEDVRALLSVVNGGAVTNY
jgi:hypothetical protein